MCSEKASHELLQFYFHRKREKNPALSVRAMAAKMGVSPSYLSRVLAGKKPLAPRHLHVLADHLEMDELAVRKVQTALVRDKLPTDFALPRLLETNSSFREADFPSYDLLSNWYLIALLDLISLKDFQASSKWIATRLRITPEKAKQAWKKLLEMKVIEKVDGRWRKVTTLLHFPTKRTDPRVRKFHIQHLELAKQELLNRTKSEDFTRRLIAGSTMAVNLEQLPQAREILLKAIQDITELLGRGECTEVYHLQIGLFPLTSQGSHC